MSEKQTLNRLRHVQAKLEAITTKVPELVVERDRLLFELLEAEVSERRIARETGISRGGIWKAKRRRERNS